MNHLEIKLQYNVMKLLNLLHFNISLSYIFKQIQSVENLLKNKQQEDKVHGRRARLEHAAFCDRLTQTAVDNLRLIFGANRLKDKNMFHREYVFFGLDEPCLKPVLCTKHKGEKTRENDAIVARV